MAKCFRMIWAAVALAACLASGAARAQPCGIPLPPNAGMPPLALTPVMVRVPQDSIIPVPTTDGLIHLSYAAQVTNAGHDKTLIGSIVPVDPLDGFRPTGTNKVIDTDGHDITGKIRLFDASLIDDAQAGQRDFTTVPGGGSGMTFFDVSYKQASDIPRLIAHRISVTPSSTGRAIVGESNPIPVSCRPPVELSAPLTGYGWWDANGCCEIVSPHRGATLPVNGDVTLPEQFAIDYVQLSAANTCCTGPVKDLKSWSFFGVPILAAATGTVVVRVNNMPEQIPGPPQGVTAETAAGNNIIEDIGGGRYILYAHLATNSIPDSIKVGSTIQVGQQIGQLGNTGSSTAPHLHFQVMDRPSALNSNGLPFVFNRQLVQGRVIGTASASELAYELGQPVNFQVTGVGWQYDKMPAEKMVFAYHVN